MVSIIFTMSFISKRRKEQNDSRYDRPLIQFNRIRWVHHFDRVYTISIYIEKNFNTYFFY